MVVKSGAGVPNLRIFGFETEDFLDDIANYKDTSHYHPRFNSRILLWMQSGSHQLTEANLDDYRAEITRRAANYPLQGIGGEIDRYLKSSPRPIPR